MGSMQLKGKCQENSSKNKLVQLTEKSYLIIPEHLLHFSILGYNPGQRHKERRSWGEWTGEEAEGKKSTSLFQKKEKNIRI